MSGFEENMEDADLSSDTLSWRNLQHIQMFKFGGQLDIIHASIWGYLWICTQLRMSLFKAFQKSELGTLVNSQIKFSDRGIAICSRGNGAQKDPKPTIREVRGLVP